MPFCDSERIKRKDDEINAAKLERELKEARAQLAARKDTSNAPD